MKLPDGQCVGKTAQLPKKQPPSGRALPSVRPAWSRGALGSSSSGSSSFGRSISGHGGEARSGFALDVHRTYEDVRYQPRDAGYTSDRRWNAARRWGYSRISLRGWFMKTLPTRLC